MSLIRIPSLEDKKLIQLNKGEFSGNIWASYNINLLDNPGKLQLSPQTEILTDSDDDAQLTYPVGFVNTKADGGSEKWWALCHQALFKTAGSGVGSFAQDAIDGTPTTALHRLYSDLVAYNDDMMVSLRTDIAKLDISGGWDSTWWTVTLGEETLTNNVDHPLRIFQNKLLIGDANMVHTVDSSDNVSNSRLTFTKDYQVVWIRESGDNVWIGCKNIRSGNAKVFLWDGFSENFNAGYDIIGKECYAGVIKDGIPYTVNKAGELLVFDGSGFSPIGIFPVFSERNKELGVVPAVQRNGMVVSDSEILILLNAQYTDNLTNLIENQLSGVWAFSKENGLYHKYSLTKDNGAGILDYGSPGIDSVGALKVINKSKGKLLIGAILYENKLAETLFHAIEIINVDDDIANIGYFITPQIPNSGIKEAWQKIYLKFKKLANATDKIIIKKRTEKKSMGDLDEPVECVWTDTDTFTSTEDWSEVSAGDEIEIISGKGSGLSANITSITEDGGTYTIVINETIAGASGTISVRASNWTVVGTIDDQNLTFQDFLLDTRSIWIQFKIVLFGTGSSPEIEEIQIRSESYIDNTL